LVVTTDRSDPECLTFSCCFLDTEQA
jgi:hypothetical protein